MNKNLKKLLLIVLVGIFAFSALNVSAAFSGKEETTRIGYDITQLNVFIFNDTGMTQTQKEATDGNIKRFEVSGINLNPVTEVKDVDGYSLVSVKLNADGGLARLKETAENIASTNKDSLSGGSNGKYLITFSVKYKLDLPEGIASVYDSDYANVFSGDQKLLKEETQANANGGLDQMIVAGVYDSNTDTVDWSNQAQYTYHTEVGDHIFTSRSNLMPDFDQYLIFENVKKPGDQEIGDQATYSMKSNYGETYRFMMYESELGSPIQDEPATDDPSESQPGQDDPEIVDPTPTNPSNPDDSKDDNIDDNKPSDDENDKDKPEIVDPAPSDPSDDEDNNNNDVVIPNDDNNNNDNNNDSNSAGTGDTVVTTTSSTTNGNSGKSSTGQTVSVPNTGANSNVNITLFGILLLASGCGIVMLTKKENSI